MKKQIQLAFGAFFKVLLPAIIGRVIPSFAGMAFIAIVVAMVLNTAPIVVFGVLVTYYVGTSLLTLRYASASGFAFTAPTTSLNLATLASEMGAYYRDYSDQIHEELQIGLFDGPLSLANRFTLMDGVIDQMVLSSDNIEDFLHQYNPSAATTFNPLANAITPQARILQTRYYEGDLQFRDKDINQSFLIYRGEMKVLARNSGADQVKTFVEYLWWDVIIPRAKQNLRQVIWQGSYAPTASYALLNICDGISTQLAAAVTASLITPVPMTSPTATNVIPLIESVFDSLGVAYQSAPDLVCNLSTAMFKLFMRANRLALGRGWSSAEASAMSFGIDGYDNVAVVHEPYLAGNGVFMARKSNLVIGLGDTTGFDDWETQRVDRLTKVMVNGKIGFQMKAINQDTGNNNVAYGY